MIQTNYKPLCFAIATTAIAASSIPVLAVESAHSVKLYTTVRPTLAYIDQKNPTDDEDTNIDVRDALSHAGVIGSVDIGNGLSAIFQGEWSIDLSQNADFGKSRRGYAGLMQGNHRIALGKQRPPHYLLIADRVDIFNHANSPFAYDQVSPFFVNNLLTYHYKNAGFRLQAAAQFNGRQGNNKQDLLNTGVSFQTKHFYIAGAFLQTTTPSNNNINNEGDEKTTLAMAMSTTFENFYLGIAYQDLETDTDPVIDDMTLSGNTLDISSAYSFSDGYKIKLGYFSFDDGIETTDSNEHEGYNITLERQLNDSVRVHIEYLDRDFVQQEDYASVSVGVRYDFSFDF